MKKYFTELFMFFFSIATAYFIGWNNTDLIWGLWITSFIVGNVSLIRSGFTALVRVVKTGLTSENIKKFQKEPNSEKIKFLIFVLIFAPFFFIIGAFFLVHFSLFHFFHAFVLSAFFPHPDVMRIVDGVNKGSGIIIHILIVKTLLMSYWIIVLQKLIFDHIRHGESAGNDDSDHSMRPYMPPFARPYIQVAKIHTLIFILAGLNAINANKYLIYVVIYSVFFFPLPTFSKAKVDPVFNTKVKVKRTHESRQ